MLSIVKDGGTSYGGFIAPQSVFAIEIKDGEASILRMPQVNAHRALEYLGLINRFATDLPDMLIPFSVRPLVLYTFLKLTPRLSSRLKTVPRCLCREKRSNATSTTLEAAEVSSKHFCPCPARHAHTFKLVELTSEQADEIVVDKAWTPWASVCAPRSQIRRLHAGQVAGQSSVRPSFVSTNHYDAADTCKHGENAMLHGTTLT